MRFIHLYLIGYFILVVGASVVLWDAGVLAQISGVWLAAAAIIAIGFGILLAISAHHPTTVATTVADQ